MNTLVQSTKPTTIPRLRKILIPIFMALCVSLGFVLSEWATIEAIRGLTIGQWIYDSPDWKVTVIAYGIVGNLSALAGVLWFMRVISLLTRRAPIWTDSSLTRLFAIAVIGFVLMNILHILSEVIICGAEIVNQCTFR